MQSILMALKSVCIGGGWKTHQSGAANFQPGNSGLLMNMRYDLEKCQKWECCCLGVLAQKAATPIEDDKKPSGTGAESSGSITGIQENVSKGLLNLLPKPLSAVDLSSSPGDGSKVQVAYQGQPGAYSEEAALKAFPNCEPVPFDEFEAAFRAVELWIVDKAILPIENSVHGSIHRNYDLLLRHRLHIVGEVQLQVDHCLLGLPGVRKEELNYVISHPQALDQCEGMLDDLGVTKVGSPDTAGAAQKVSLEGRRDIGAIASSRAAKLYGLGILEEIIQDNDENITRFLILAREPIIPGTDRLYKTSIVFSLEAGPGLLFKALAVFSLRNISLTKIESRPLKQCPIRIVDDSNEGSFKYFDYLFYIDFEASMAEPRAQYALGHLQEYARFIRVLGCYPIHASRSS